MSMEHPNILYVGDIERGRALYAAAGERDWYVYLPADMWEALTMYTFYFPDVIVIDAAARYTLAQEVYFHLRSVNAQPMLILADDSDPDPWNASEPAVRLLPHTLSRAELLTVIADAVRHSYEQRLHQQFHS